MTNITAFILCAGLLAACASSGPVARRDPNDHRGYAADAMRCSQASMRMEAIKVPTPHALSVVEIPTIPDAGRFTACMDYAKWPVARADTAQYLKVSTVCLNRARNADNADETYADCIKASQLSIELIPNQ
ncbi:hypothetical protein [Methylomonas sp. CM2]|uniref:hypothetical protein n=1 Tax=Methylomonas sp. CM2 TaxID=3417647 RepID=UPI003CF1EF38